MRLRLAASQGVVRTGGRCTVGGFYEDGSDHYQAFVTAP